MFSHDKNGEVERESWVLLVLAAGAEGKLLAPSASTVSVLASLGSNTRG